MSLCPRIDGPSSRPRRGFTLMEVAIVFGVVALVLSAIWVGAGSVWLNYSVYRTQNQVRTLVQNVREYYGASGRTRLWNNNQNITAMLNNDPPMYPSDMRGAGGAITHAFGGAVNVVALTNGTLLMRVALQGLSREACTQMVMKLPVLSREAGIVRVQGPGQNVAVDIANVANPGGGVALPFTLGTAINMCNQAGAANVLSIDFKIRN